RVAPRRRRQGGRRCARDHARLGPRGADRLRGAQGGRVRPQGVDVAGRRSASADRGGLLERRHREVRARARRADTDARIDLGTDQRSGGFMAAVVPQHEVDRRYGRVREAMARDGLDYVIVSGNEYSGFEGAVTYMSGFVIVHRYAYVLLPIEGEPSIVFPREATYVGEHGTTWIGEQVFVDKPGDWLADRVKGKRVGVYGLDYVMTVRDYAALDGAAE